MKILAIVCAALLLSACNTFEGLGKDIGKAGETLENAAKKK